MLSGILPVVGEIIGKTKVAMQALDSIQKAVDAWFAANPNQEHQEEFAKVMGVARNTLEGALAAAEGAEHASQEDVDVAWDKFQLAYEKLSDTLGDMGFRVASPDEEMLYSSGDGSHPTIYVVSAEKLELELDK